MSKDYEVLLYYKYVDIDDPEQFTKDELMFCKSIGLRGRILISDEGINGTVSGPKEVTKKYMDHMHAMDKFSDLWFKINEADDYAHKKMFVRYRPEIVSLKLDEDLDPNQITGNHLDPKDFRTAMQDEDTVLIDTRNDYEYELGHFQGAINPDIRAFRELPQWLQDNKDKFMDKKVLVYCTGGVRCEKLSGYLVREGIGKEIGQLNGGIENYGQDEETRGDLWEGKMYVFDERISVPINRVSPSVIGEDYFDGTPCERYVNCGNPECNRQMLASEENQEKYLGGCSHECRVHPRNRYIQAKGWSTQEVADRLAAIGEELPATVEF
ncbi:rhodanese-related sulfurtransferase [Aerococcus kribbianus]|uniref:tRNA uridine(34) hydroxylase n=1 Tax=Aerococcus kribbianus TaxID=2999064 RepID=A0A9X3FPE5_9LACT|nr:MULTISPECIES: rhodanese-related sulfurtransferase [unclassified Aerococcus]MCZ0717268.1 rhodanese-related sulfurtransferase [Aerococcus sp. YH-aer221]MCZ0725556.1 rhodanese-related sulfurtransferase [Aerococcus sp. YH-aer222]